MWKLMHCLVSVYCMGKNKFGINFGIANAFSQSLIGYTVPGRWICITLYINRRSQQYCCGKKILKNISRKLLKIIYNWVLSSLSLSKIIILYNYRVFCFKVQKLRLETLRCLLKNYQIYFKNALIIHEENTKEMNV
jgi:hypothetical protein